MDGLNLVEIVCECGNSSSGSYGVHIDTNNGEVVCRQCGLVSEKYCWSYGEIHEKETG